MRRDQQSLIVDCETPVSMFQKLRGLGANIFLDSPQPHAQGERFAIIGFGGCAKTADDLASGLRQFREAEWEGKHAAHLGHADLPFVGGLMFVGGGSVPFLFSRVDTVVTYDNFKRVATVSRITDGNGSDDETERIAACLRQPSGAPLAPLPLSTNAVGRAPEPEPRSFSGAYVGDPFRAFRVLRAVDARPFMAFFDLGSLSVAGSGTSELLTVRDRAVEVRTPRAQPVGRPPTIQVVAEALRPVLDVSAVLGSETRPRALVNDTIELETACGTLARGRTPADALAAVLEARGEDEPPVVGFLGWSGHLNSAALETTVIVDEGRFMASAWPGSDGARLGEALSQDC